MNTKKQKIAEPGGNLREIGATITSTSERKKESSQNGHDSQANRSSVIETVTISHVTGLIGLGRLDSDSEVQASLQPEAE